MHATLKDHRSLHISDYLAFQSKVHQDGQEKISYEFDTMSILLFLRKIKHSATEAWIKLNWTY